MGKVSKAIKTGVGLAALAAAAGAYFLEGKRGARSRRRIRGWTLKVKGEVLEGLERFKDQVDVEAYKEMVDKVAARYKKLKDVNQQELSALAKELKDSWKHFSQRPKA